MGHHRGSWRWLSHKRGQACQPDVGAGRGLEVPFVFDNLATAADDAVIGTDLPQDLTDEMKPTWRPNAATSVRSGLAEEIHRPG